jgi:DNA polymerase III alpha subunit
MNAPTDQLILPLHVHSYNSLLDGASSPEEHVEFAKEKGMPAVAITDHGSLGAWFAQACSCKKHDILGIFGIEIYLIPRDGYEFNTNQKALNYFHLTLWALNLTGYRSLSALASKSWSQTHKNRPLVKWEDLALHSEGVCCGSGCLLGPVAYPIIRGEKEEGVRALCRLREIFGPDRLFLEIMPHAVDRNYTGRDRELISVMGEDGVCYRFDPDDILETDCGPMTAKQAMTARVQEIYGAAPSRVQDGEGLSPSQVEQPDVPNNQILSPTGN